MCRCACRGLLHGDGAAFRYAWAGGSTVLRNGSPHEVSAVAVFADLVDDDDLAAAASEIRGLARSGGLLEAKDDDGAGRVLRLIGELERAARMPPGLGARLARPGASSLRVDSPQALSRDVHRLRGAIPRSPDLELALLLALPDLTEGTGGHAAFAADGDLVTDALLGGCTGSDGSRVRRPGRRRDRLDARAADNELRSRIRRSVDALPARQRLQYDEALLFDHHLLCRLALAAAGVLDRPNELAGAVGTGLAQVVTDLYFAETPAQPKRAGVYVGGLILGEVLGEVVGIEVSHSCAQIARVIAWITCPNRADHPEVIEALRDFARIRLEDSAVGHFFAWAGSLASAA